MVMNLPANAGASASIPGLGRIPLKRKSSILAQRTPGAEEPGGLQAMESQSQTGARRHLVGKGSAL